MSPGIVPGLAPTATEAPPASTGPSGRSPATGKTFADTVAEHRATQDAADHTAAEANPETPAPPAAQAASESNAPPGEPTAETTSADAAGLLALVQDLLDASAGATETTTTAVPLLDRPAGAGDTETEPIDVNAMEALMAQTLLMRTPAPDADVTIAPIAVAAAPVDASGRTAASALDGLQQAIADLAGATAPAGAAMDADAPVAATVDTFADAIGSLDTPAMTTALPAAETVATEAASTAQTAEAAQAQPFAALMAEDASQDAPALTDMDVTPVVQRAPAPEAPASIVVDGGETEVSLPGLQMVSDEPSSPNEGGESEPRRMRVESTTTSAMPQTAPAVQGEHLAQTAAAGRVEVATGGAVTSQIANTVQSAVLRGEQEVRLVLNPPELGRVEIQIVESSGGIRVHMLADQPGARDLIERQLPLLQQALAARDVRVERMEVSRSGDAASAQQWSNSQGSNDGQRQRGQQDGGTPDWSPLAAMGLGLTESARAERPKAATGGLDVMA